MKIRCTLLAAVLLSGNGCGSVGTAQKRVDDRPISFGDASSGARVVPVLIIPKYNSMTGVSTGAGHGPGRVLAEERFLANPFVYWEGSPFQPKQPDSRGMLLGPLAFVGRGIALDGVVVISRNHRALWWWSLWERKQGDRPSLAPLTDAVAYRQRMLALLAGEEIRGRDLTDDERESFSLIADFDLKVRFSAEERRTVREFLKSGS